VSSVRAPSAHPPIPSENGLVEGLPVPRSPYLLVEDVAARDAVSPRWVHERTRTETIPHRRLPGSRRCLFVEAERRGRTRRARAARARRRRAGREAEVTEREFERSVLDVPRLLGWRFIQFRPARTGRDRAAARADCVLLVIARLTRAALASQRDLEGAERRREQPQRLEPVQGGNEIVEPVFIKSDVLRGLFEGSAARFRLDPVGQFPGGRTELGSCPQMPDHDQGVLLRERPLDPTPGKDDERHAPPMLRTFRIVRSRRRSARPSEASYLRRFYFGRRKRSYFEGGFFFRQRSTAARLQRRLLLVSTAVAGQSLRRTYRQTVRRSTPSSSAISGTPSRSVRAMASRLVGEADSIRDRV
jgi:hypothetical protein